MGANTTLLGLLTEFHSCQKQMKVNKDFCFAPLDPYSVLNVKAHNTTLSVVIIQNASYFPIAAENTISTESERRTFWPGNKILTNKQRLMSTRSFS